MKTTKFKTALPTVLMAGAVLALSGCVIGRGNPDCPTDARDLPLQSLYGRWEARFDGLPAVAVVQRGTITRNGASPDKARVAQLAGDVDDEGALSIDESQDGRAISGVWSGKLQKGSCGREFRGTWRDASDESTHPFVLAKTAAKEEGKQ